MEVSPIGWDGEPIWEIDWGGLGAWKDEEEVKAG